MDDKLRDRLHKLYELVKRGVAGEQETASRKLNELLERNGLTIDDLNEDIRKDRYYKFTNNQNKIILRQILYHVVENAKVYSIKGFKEFCCEVTDFEHVQIVELIDFHFKNLANDIKQIINDVAVAYVRKHDIYSKTTSDNQARETELTDEEKQALYRQLKLEGALSNNSYIKKLN